MAQYYTLDEASKKLGIATDDFRKRLATEWKTLRRFPDGATLRFQSRDIDELARTLGRASDPDLQLGEAPLTLAEEPAPPITGKKNVPNKSEPAIYVPAPSSADFVPLSLDENVMSGPEKKGKPGSDSDVKLESSGSKVRPVSGQDEPTEVMEKPKKKETFDIKSESKKPPSRTVHVASEFDLSLNTDSDDFDLQLTDDDSDEVDLGNVSRKSPRAGGSGINLQDPVDSGISLEKDSSEFELQLDPEPSSKTKGPDTGKMPPTAKVDADPDSEFELTLDDPAAAGVAATAFDSGDQKDIFETDFELPAIDDSSGSEEKSDSDLEDSDFDISIGEDDGSGEDSASEVVAVEEDDIEDLQPIEDDAPDLQPVATVAGAPAQWGKLPAFVLAPTVLVMFFVGIMSYELLSSMWSYHTNSRATGPIVRTLAEQFGEFPKD